MVNLKKVVACFLTMGVLLSFFASKEAIGEAISTGINQAEANRVVGEVAIPYIAALQAGDVQTLQQLIDGRLAITLGTLLRDNQEYPNFLKNKYGKNHLLDTKSTLEQKVAEGFVVTGNDHGSGVLKVEMSQDNGNLMNLQLSLDKDKAGNWKVVDQKIIK